MGKPLPVYVERTLPDDKLEILSWELDGHYISVPREVSRYLYQYRVKLVGELFLLPPTVWQTRRHRCAKYFRELMEALELPVPLDLVEIGWRPWYVDNLQVQAAWNMRMHELGPLYGPYRFKHGPFPDVPCRAEKGCMSVGEFLRDKAKRTQDDFGSRRLQAYFAYHGLYPGMYVPKDWEPPARDPQGCQRHGRVLWEGEYVLPDFRERFVSEGFETLASIAALSRFGFKQKFGNPSGQLLLMLEDHGLAFATGSAEEEALMAPLSSVEWTQRTGNCLTNNGILTFLDLISHSEGTLLRKPNFGRKSLREVKDVLALQGLHLKTS